MSINKKILKLVIIAGVLGVMANAFAIVYLTKEEALKLVFPHSTEVKMDRKVLTPEQKARVEKLLGRKLEEDAFTFYVGKTGEKVDGYAIIRTEKGRHRPITFIVGLDPAGKVTKVAIMVYREPRGDEVRRKRFLKQYVGKDSDDPIAVNKDIRNISGATISCEMVSIGVKKAAVLCQELYLDN